jgi:anti-sigma B factor antagonist
MDDGEGIELMGNGSQLTHQVEERGDAVLITLHGIVNCTHSGQFSQSIKEARERYARKHLVLDFSDVAHIDSSGLGALVAERSRTVKTGVDFRICCLGESVRKVFHMAHLDRLFQLYDCQEDALKG